MSALSMPDEEPQSPAEPELTAAPLERRLVAGLVDAAVLGVSLALCFWFQTRYVGAFVPLYTIAALALAWNVVPAWVYGSTLGMGLLGLRFIGTDGEPPDLLELSFRELIGRGLLPVAFLGTFIIGMLSAMFGVGMITLPVGMGLLFFVVAVSFVAGAALGQGVMLIRKDKRSGADIIAKVIVIVDPELAGGGAHKPAEPDDSSDDGLEQWNQHQKRQRITKLVGLELVLLAVAFGMPFLQKLDLSSDNPYDRAAALKAESELNELKRNFDMDRTHVPYARDLIRRLQRDGKSDEVENVREQHRQAKIQRDEPTVKKLLGEIEDPNAWPAMRLLLGIYQDHERLDEAKTAYARFIKAHDDGESVAEYALWLYRHDFDQEAVAAFERALAKGQQQGQIYAYYGFALENVGRKADAKEAYTKAVELDGNLARDLMPRLEALEP